MKNNYLKSYAVIVLMLLSSSVMAQFDENFDTQGFINNNGSTATEIIGEWTFSMDGSDFIATPNASEFIINLNNSGDPNDRCLLLNLNSFDIRVFTLKTTNGAEFDMTAMAFGQATTSGTATSFEFTGFRNGIAVTMPEAIDITASDSDGAIHYNFIGTTAGGSYGNLTFQSAYNNVDEIRITANGSASVEIDDIIANSPTLSLETSSPNSVHIYPNPSNDVIQVSGLTNSKNFIIYNVVGEEIAKGTASHTTPIDIRHFSSGTYILKFENGSTLKFVKD